MTAGNGNEPAWMVGETRSIKGKLVICEHGYHSNPSPAEGLKYLPGPMLCLVEIGKPAKTVADHEDKYVSRTRKILKCIDMSIPLRLLMCDIADAENARYEAENPGKKVPVEAINSVLAGRKFAAGEITLEEMLAVNRASSHYSYYYSSHYSYYSSYYSSHYSYYYSSHYSYYYSYSRYPELIATYNRLALEALANA